MPHQVDLVSPALADNYYPQAEHKLMKEPLNSFPREVENSGMRAISNRHDVAYAFTHLVCHP
jgi:hypothetical protein